MRYFRIYADKQNPQPRLLDWYSKIKPGRTEREIYEELKHQNCFQVELNSEVSFLDILSHPCFMVSKEFANLIRVYCPGMEFKYVTLSDQANKRLSRYQIPDLPEIDCLDAKSEWNRDRLITGILKEERISGFPIFRLGGMKRMSGYYVVANLEFVESAYRREVTGMRIDEYVVQ